MKYIYETTNASASFLANRLKENLNQGKKILWLMSGGSGGTVCFEASRMLIDTDLSNLFVTMSDERYGPLGHPDENWQILLDQGLSLPGATLYRPLSGDSRDQTVENLCDWLSKIVNRVDFIIVLAGIGSDGHTFGAKPRSIATTSDDIAVGYRGDDFERITITPSFARKFISEAVVQAFGNSKHEVIKKLISNDSTPMDFPALLYHDIPEVTLFGDFNPNIHNR